MTMDEKKLPPLGFVCPGAAKSGTTWLYRVLVAHPVVRLSKAIKESNIYLQEDPGEAAKLYHRYFNGWKEGELTGEICPKYFQDTTILERLLCLSRDLKVIIMLRDPVDRAYSHYCMYLRGGAASENISEELVEGSIFVEESRYSKIIPEYQRRVRPENLLLLDFKLIRSDPQLLLDCVTEFLGVAPMQGQGLEKEVNKKIGRFRFPRLARGIYEFVWWSRKKFFFSSYIFNAISFCGGKKAFQMMASKNIDFPALSNEVRQRLIRIFEEDYRFMKKNLKNYEC